MDKPHIKRVVIDLPENQHRLLKVSAAAQGVSLKSFVLDALRQQTQHKPEQSRNG